MSDVFRMTRKALESVGQIVIVAAYDAVFRGGCHADGPSVQIVRMLFRFKQSRVAGGWTGELEDAVGSGRTVACGGRLATPGASYCCPVCRHREDCCKWRQTRSRGALQPSVHGAQGMLPCPVFRRCQGCVGCAPRFRCRCRVLLPGNRQGKCCCSRRGRRAVRPVAR